MSHEVVRKADAHRLNLNIFPNSALAEILSFMTARYVADRALCYCVGLKDAANPGYKVELFDLSMTQMIPEVRKICIPQLEPGHIRFVWVYRLEHCKPLHAFEED